MSHSQNTRLLELMRQIGIELNVEDFKTNIEKFIQKYNWLESRPEMKDVFVKYYLKGGTLDTQYERQQKYHATVAFTEAFKIGALHGN